MLRRSVGFFLRQTYPSRELVVACEDDDAESIAFVTSLENPKVRLSLCAASEKLSLGERRQLSVDAAFGEYIAIWDDDDWHAPDRLASQIAAIENSRFDACVLSQVIVLDQLTGTAYVGEVRTWECTMVCRKLGMPPYPAYSRNEDIAVIEALKAKDQLGILGAPHLYVYAYHGANVGSRVHFRRRIFSAGKVLSAEASKRAAQVLMDPSVAPIAPAELVFRP